MRYADERCNMALDGASVGKGMFKHGGLCRYVWVETIEFQVVVSRFKANGQYSTVVWPDILFHYYISISAMTHSKYHGSNKSSVNCRR